MSHPDFESVAFCHTRQTFCEVTLPTVTSKRVLSNPAICPSFYPCPRPSISVVCIVQHRRQLSSSSICFSRLEFVSPDPQSSCGCHIRDEWFLEFNLCRKTDGSVFPQYCLPRHVWVCLRQTDRYFLEWCSVLGLCRSQVFELVHLWHTFLYIGRWPWLEAGHDFAFVRGDFHTVSSSCFLQPFNELLQFFFTGSQKTDIVNKLQVVEQSLSDGCWGVSLLHYLFEEYIK